MAPAIPPLASAPPPRRHTTAIRLLAVTLLAMVVVVAASTSLGFGRPASCQDGASTGCPTAAPGVTPTLLTGTASESPFGSVQPTEPEVIVTPEPTDAGPPPATTFDEEFNGSRLDDQWSRNWPGFGVASWSHSQLSVGNGVLTLTAKRFGSGWLSDEIDTAGSFSQKYGVFSARVKISQGAGFWPAFWLSQPPNHRGQEDEIDVMEVCANPAGQHATNDVTLLHNFVHRDDGTNAFGVGFRTNPLGGEWHVYTLEWRRDHVSFFFDGLEVSRFVTTAEIPNVPMVVALDFAVGGWCGQPNKTTPSPATMQVDWVRVTK